MNEPAKDIVRHFIEKSRDALASARREQPLSAVASINRSYYAAFYAVSAVLAAQGQTFTRHSAVRSALHRDLINAGRLADEIGTAYDELFDARGDSDYNSMIQVGPPDAAVALELSERVVAALLALIDIQEEHRGQEQS